MGLTTYIVKLYDEIISHDLSQTISARIIFRTMVEAYIKTAYDTDALRVSRVVDTRSQRIVSTAVHLRIISGISGKAEQVGCCSIDTQF